MAQTSIPDWFFWCGTASWLTFRCLLFTFTNWWFKKSARRTRHGTVAHTFREFFGIPITTFATPVAVCRGPCRSFSRQFGTENLRHTVAHTHFVCDKYKLHAATSNWSCSTTCSKYKFTRYKWRHHVTDIWLDRFNKVVGVPPNVHGILSHLSACHLFLTDKWQVPSRFKVLLF